MSGLGVYVQIPFCASKCTFCNFSSKVAPASIFDDYLRALASEIANLTTVYSKAGIPARILELAVDSVYIGGGTPSLLGIDRLRSLISKLRARFRFGDSPEFTLEVTPGSADEGFLSAARELGINRLSVGAQSFEDRELRAVGRLHNAEDTRATIRHARNAGFDNISLDLIAGLPHQTKSSWPASLDAAISLRLEHLSIYLFEIDEKSRLGREVLAEGARYSAAAVPDDDFMADAYELARRILRGEGYVQYEISNFALPGRKSQHNQKYWRLQPYVGLGAGAHSFDGERRWANESLVEKYQARIEHSDPPICDARELRPEEQLEEFFFLGLRQSEGVELRDARQRWGETGLERWEPELRRLESEGWIERNSDRVALRESSYLTSNEIFQRFIALDAQLRNRRQLSEVFDERSPG